MSKRLPITPFQPPFSVIFHENANMSKSSLDIFKEQLYLANKEYSNLRTEREGLLDKLAMNDKRLIAIQAGQAGDTFEGEKAGLESERARLVELEDRVQWRSNRCLEIIHDCIKALREAASRSSSAATEK